MIIELMDGTKIDHVKGVYGGPKLIDGVVRDTLRIEIEPIETLESIISKFKDNPNTMKLYTNNTTIKEDKSLEYDKTLMGEGYTIFVSGNTIEKKIPHEPGKLLPDKVEMIHEIIIAQLTYDEYKGGV